MNKSNKNEIIDNDGNVVSVGDKVRGKGLITFQDGFKIDRTPVVTVRKDNNGQVYFGNLSIQSFPDFWLVNKI